MKEMKSRNIGIKAKEPAGRCNDSHCPFHGKALPRGRIFTGTVIAKDAHKTATVEWSYRYFIPKYERHEMRRTKIHVHNPQCIDAQLGDIVRITETRPISKTKNFVIIENIGKEKGFKEKIEAIEASKVHLAAEGKDELRESREGREGREEENRDERKKENGDEMKEDLREEHLHRKKSKETEDERKDEPEYERENGAEDETADEISEEALEETSEEETESNEDREDEHTENEDEESENEENEYEDEETGDEERGYGTDAEDADAESGGKK